MIVLTVLVLLNVFTLLKLHLLPGYRCVTADEGLLESTRFVPLIELVSLGLHAPDLYLESLGLLEVFLPHSLLQLAAQIVYLKAHLYGYQRSTFLT